MANRTQEQDEFGFTYYDDNDVTTLVTCAVSANLMDYSANPAPVTIRGIAEPSTATDATPKSYADSVVTDVYARTVVNTATYTVVDGDNIIGVTYTTTGACTITLPAISVVGTKLYTIVDEGGNAKRNNITVDTTGADTILGTTAAVINQDYNSLRVYNDGTSAWFVF